jgi:predicted dehydrogenase
MDSISRRRFIQSSAAAGAAVAAGPTFAREVGANDKINVACIGVNGRGDGVMRVFAGMKDVTITHICDISRNVLDTRAGAIEKVTGHKPKTTDNYEDVLKARDVDAVMIATPEHWHAIMAIRAAQEGKDVYVEKPDGHNIHEGRMMVAAARKHGRMMQVGTQARSAGYLKEAAAYVKGGALGKVLFGKAWESARQGAIPRIADEDPPPGVDYDRWLGPAPLRKFNRMRFHGNWRWFFDYGTGDLGNDGVHRMDYCRAVMGITDMPTRIVATGGKMFFDDAQDWPDTQMVSYEFGGSPAASADGRGHGPTMVINYEMRLWTRPPLHGHTEAGAVYGENGSIIVYNGGAKVYDPKDNVIKEWGGGDATGEHVRNFLDCCRSRKWQELNQDIYSGHVSSVMCHTGNLAWRTGLALHFDGKTETFAEAEANKYVSREYRKGYELPVV